MRRGDWDRKYADSELLWGVGPNRFVEEALGGVGPDGSGRALDLACGEGRNAIWLAQRGWRVTAVDFSPVALDRGREIALRAGVDVEFVEADLTTWEPEPGAFALVVVSYLQVPAADRQRVWRCAARALEPGGRLFAVGHALRNLAEGTGGPRSPEVLWDPEVLADELAHAGFDVERADHVPRDVEGAGPDAIDALVSARRGAGAPSGASSPVRS